MPVSVSILVYAADVHQGARQIPRWRWRQLQECQWDKGCMAMPLPQITCPQLSQGVSRALVSPGLPLLSTPGDALVLFSLCQEQGCEAEDGAMC